MAANKPPNIRVPTMTSGVPAGYLIGRSSKNPGRAEFLSAAAVRALVGPGVIKALGGSSLIVKDEGSEVSAVTTSMDFVGAGVAAAGSGNVTVTIPGYTDEQAQDAVGAMVGNTSTAALVYDDGNATLRASVVGNGNATTFLNGAGSYSVPAGNATTSIDLFSPPLASNFSTLIGSATSADVAGLGLVVTSAAAGGAGDHIGGAFSNVAATPYTYTARIRATMYGANFRFAGLGLTDGTKFIFLFVGGPAYTYSLTNMNTTTSFNSNSVSNLTAFNEHYFRVNNDGTNLTWSISADGRNFQPIFKAAKGAFLGTITQVGFGFDLNPSVAPSGTADLVYAAVPYFAGP